MQEQHLSYMFTKPASPKSKPPAIASRIFTSSFSGPIVAHFKPKRVIKIAMNPIVIDDITRARQTCKTPDQN